MPLQTLLIALLALAIHCAPANAQTAGFGVRAMPEFEDDDAPKPGIEYVPRSTHLPNTGKNPERGNTVSYRDAVNCAALIEIIHLAHMNYKDSPDIANLGVDSTGSRHRAWSAMIATNPDLRSMPFNEAERHRAALLNAHINKHVFPYFDNLPKLARDYRRCQALQLIGPD